jgi:predicted nucleotidyltransferase
VETAHVTGKLKDILAELHRELAVLYGGRLARMVLYGSQARGDAEDGSDIDVLIVLKGPVDAGEEVLRTGGIVSDLCLKHTVVISRAFVPEDRFDAEQSPFLVNVRKEGVPV